MSAELDMMSGSVSTDRTTDDLSSKAVHLTPRNIRRALQGIPLKAKLALRAATQLPHGSLTIQLPDKRIIKVGGNNPGPEAELILHNWNLPVRAITELTIGVGESFMDGDWESPDVTAFLQLFVANETLGHQIVRANHAFPHVQRDPPLAQSQYPTRARKNISAHYDLGNEFYSRWLDPSMTYSSALFSDGANDLESAQAAKYRALAGATGIGPGDHVLEIGCGWGGFAEFAAREIGCKVTGLTISREQLDFARERIRQAPASRTGSTLKFQDYRDEQAPMTASSPSRCSRLSAKNTGRPISPRCTTCLKPGGRAGLQIITINERPSPNTAPIPDFIQRYVFPGGMLPTPQILRGSDRPVSTCEKVDELVFPQDYARTLRMWRERFWARVGPGQAARLRRPLQAHVGVLSPLLRGGFRRRVHRRAPDRLTRRG